MADEDVLVDVGDPPADDRGEDVLRIELGAQGAGQARPQPAERGRLVRGQVIDVGRVTVALDDEMAEGREAVVARRGVVDPKAVQLRDQLAVQGPLTPMLGADLAVAAHGAAA